MHEAMIINPKDSHWAPDNADALIQLLLRIGLIEHPADTRYEYGQQFSRLISFLGCSPTLYRTDDNGTMFPVYLPHATEQPVLLAGDAARPHCRSCNRPVQQWQTHVQNNQLVCPHCGQQSNTQELRWRRSGCFARAFIIIDGIMDGIAVPSDVLFAELRTLGGGDWDYGYYRGNQPWQEQIAGKL
ncbi:MAG: hypothetical protein OEZ10_04945 [Gammaproteobacteria bacterium]|nr:hypothetical protein [Gammaproteobacteria bacterium]